MFSSRLVKIFENKPSSTKEKQSDWGRLYKYEKAPLPNRRTVVAGEELFKKIEHLSSELKLKRLECWAKISQEKSVKAWSTLN